MITELLVHHQSGDCRVVIGRGVIGQMHQCMGSFAERKSCAVITDKNVGDLYLDDLLDRLCSGGMQPVPIVVSAGESSKSLDNVAAIIDQLAAAHLDRHSFIIALGGGVIGDLAGFVAAIYYRGIPYIQVPTTVIAQCDSAIGGKTGVNTATAKNLIGAFHPAGLVLVDPDVLRSLPKREYNEGFAEAIKHGIIRDPALFDALALVDDESLPGIIRRNLEIKAQVVNEDEFERTGLRATLNFGHTIGHGIEQAAGYGHLLHGEAISLGMVAASRISARKAGLPPSDVQRIITRLEQFSLPTSLPANISTDAVLQSLALDKKFESGRIRFVLSPQIGEAFLSEVGQVTQRDLREAVEELRLDVA